MWRVHSEPEVRLDRRPLHWSVQARGYRYPLSQKYTEYTETIIVGEISTPCSCFSCPSSASVLRSRISIETGWHKIAKEDQGSPEVQNRHKHQATRLRFRPRRGWQILWSKVFITSAEADLLAEILVVEKFIQSKHLLLLNFNLNFN